MEKHCVINEIDKEKLGTAENKYSSYPEYYFRDENQNPNIEYLISVESNVNDQDYMIMNNSFGLRTNVLFKKFHDKDDFAISKRGYRNSLISSTFDCYKYHMNLIWKPDDLWITILTSLSLHIKNNPAEFRNFFVNFENQKELVINDCGELETIEWEKTIQHFTNLAKEFVKNDIYEWINDGFSTTTDIDKIIYEVCFMDTMKSYFKFTMMLYSCGIPNITLKGTLEDWIKLKEKVKKLNEFTDTTKKWFSVLEPILDKLIETYQGKIDKNFWNKICVCQDDSCIPQTIISGWILAFCPFDHDGKYVLDIHKEDRIFKQTYQSPWGGKLVETKVNFDSWKHKDFSIITYHDRKKMPLLITKVPVKIIDHGKENEVNICAGIFGSLINQKDRTMKLYSGYAIVKEN